ncbi:MAG: hypothetical protein R2797_12950 [Gelidibacter sp.]
MNDRDSVSYFVPNASASLFVEEGQNAVYDVKIGISEPKPYDRSFTYSIDPSSTAVEGVDYTISSSLTIPANSIVGQISITGNFENAVLEGKKVKLILDSVEGSVLGSRTAFTLTLVKSCPFSGLESLNYVAEVTAFDETAPAYEIELVPVAGQSNQWTIATAWGPSFVAWATGNPAYDGQYLYPATIVLNSDFSVTIVGNASYATGGAGEYSPCNKTFSYTIQQALFTTQFDTSVVLTPID